jgi:hypothetical protein
VRTNSDKSQASAAVRSDASVKPGYNRQAHVVGGEVITAQNWAHVHNDELTNTGKDTVASYVTVSPPVLLGARKRLTQLVLNPRSTT